MHVSVAQIGATMYGRRSKNMAAPTLVRYSTCFLLKRLNMVKIELLIPLSYFGIVCTLSTETVKIADFVFFLSFFWLFQMHRALTMRRTNINPNREHSLWFSILWVVLKYFFQTWSRKSSPLYCWFGVSLWSPQNIVVTYGWLGIRGVWLIPVL